ncbi:MAG: DNA polymerase III subunit alpha [Schwartzia sp.]|nr:DNA polymerase III subunit alpha [Schwartzia sp. (in: firmicutes)]
MDTSTSAIPFTHLHVHTEYSLLDGASRIPALIQETKRLGMDAIAITDHGQMYGAVTFYKEAKKAGVKPIIGCEVYLAPRDRREMYEVDHVRYYHLILLAENDLGYRNLSKLVSLANIEGTYYKPRVDKELLRQYHEGIICLSACIAGEIPRALIQDNEALADRLVQEYIGIFGRENFFIEMQKHGIAEEQKCAPGLMALAEKYGLGLVVTNDAHYIRREDAAFHDILLCIQTGKTLDDPGRMRFQNDEFYLKSPAEMAQLFPGRPDMMANTVRIAERCNVEFTFGRHYLPKFPLPEGRTDEAYLRELCEEKVGDRYQPVTAEIRERLDYELSIIHRMGFDSYFLIVWDFINYARGQGIAVGPGRGSAAGSIVAYVLGITDIDPLRYALLFERFLNPERVSMPDIDVDFCYIRRKEVIEYVKRRYGEDHVAQIVTFGTMAARGAVRDVGRVMNMPYAEVDRVAKLIPTELGITLDKALRDSGDLKKLYEESSAVRRIIDFARDIEGLPRQSSTHAAGVVIAREPLTEYMPVQISDGTLVTAYDKDLVEELGLLKMDFLGLRTLTVIADAIKNIRESRGETVDIRAIPLRDEKTAKMLSDGKTGAVFQMESAGMTALVKDLQPESFEDLIPTVALYRPGPLGSGMVQDFINGRRGKKQVTYLHPMLEPILRETFGVVLYQEQVMQIVQVLAGFSLGQADLLRRAMGHKQPELLMKQKEGFLAGTKANGIDDALAEKIFELLTHFANYGFNKSHSAAYALVAWQTAYLKAHYPAEFMAAMLTSVIDSGDKVSVYIELARRMGIPILPPDINASSATFSVDGEAIRFGLMAVRHVGENAIAEVERVRAEKGRFTSLADFCARVDMRVVNKRVIENFIKCGAFDSLNLRRSQLLAVMDRTIDAASRQQRETMSGQMGLFGDDVTETLGGLPLPDIPEEEPSQLLAWEKEITGFYITGHPLDEYQDTLRNLCPIARLLDGSLGDGRLVRIGGMVAEAKRIATKKGDTMCFLTLEDFTHQLEIIVFPRLFYERMDFLAADTPLVVQGKVDTTDTGAKLLADTIWPLAEYRPDYFITIDGDRNTEENLQRLRDIFARYHGDQTVYLHFVDKKQRIRTEPQFWLNGDPAATAAIESLFGEGSVRRR